MLKAMYDEKMKSKNHPAVVVNLNVNKEEVEETKKKDDEDAEKEMDKKMLKKKYTK